MTQIKGTFEGCGEAPAPLKLNEVFISRADSTLNTARSRAVTVNVSLQSIRCLFSLTNGPERTKGQGFLCYFSCISLTQLLPFSPSSSSPSLSISFFCPITKNKVSLPSSSVCCRRKPIYCGFLSDLGTPQWGLCMGGVTAANHTQRRTNKNSKMLCAAGQWAR